MRVLYFDIDTLRADHLGCYGYHRNTSPNIDRIAEEGIRFDNCYASDTPCLPSRSASFTGRFGIHTGVINHGGEDADPKKEGISRSFRQSPDAAHWPAVFKEAGYNTVSISPFAERHSAWWFYNGFKEMYNPGKGGQETADEIMVYADKWLNENAENDNWFLHINVWDPHTPYRVPLEYGNPFENEPLAEWHTEDVLKRNYNGYGPHSPRDLGWNGTADGFGKYPRIPKEIKTMADYKKWIDGYDTGIKYADDAFGKIIKILDEKGVLDDTVIIISSDHGESQGELGVYGDHQTADNIVARIPYIVRWPGLKTKKVFNSLFYQADLMATILELAGLRIPKLWDGKSFAENIKNSIDKGRDYLVVSQGAWICQRSVVFGDWILMRTYDTGLKPYPEIMLYNIKEDFHLLNDVAAKYPEVVKEGLALLEEWHTEMMQSSNYNVDPMWNVIREGGPFHTRNNLNGYIERLRNSDREVYAELLEKNKGMPIEKIRSGKYEFIK